MYSVPDEMDSPRGDPIPMPLQLQAVNSERDYDVVEVYAHCRQTILNNTREDFLLHWCDSDQA